MSFRVLLIEDEPDLQEYLRDELLKNDCDVTIASDGEIAQTLLHSEKFDLVVSDWMIPKIDGRSVIQSLRSQPSQNSSIPILMVTAKISPDEIVEGLRCGADDYICKPIDPKVFQARVTALLRRFVNSQKPPVEEIHVAGKSLVMNLKSKTAYSNGKLIHLTAQEFKTLALFLSDPEKIHTRDTIMRKIHGITVTNNAVDFLIFQLRKKLPKKMNMIESVRGVGWRINNEVMRSVKFK